MTTAIENATATARAEQVHPLKQTLVPLALDIAVPLGAYYLLHTGFGVGTAAA